MFLDARVRPAILTLAAHALVVLPVDSRSDDTEQMKSNKVLLNDAIQPRVSNCEAVAGALKTQRHGLLHAPTGSQRACELYAPSRRECRAQIHRPIEEN